MATWIKFMNHVNRLTYVDLDAMSFITHDDKSQRIDFWSGSAFATLDKKRDPAVYQQVVEYLNRLVQT
jgi:hypothetical protein